MNRCRFLVTGIFILIFLNIVSQANADDLDNILNASPPADTFSPSNEKILFDYIEHNLKIRLQSSNKKIKRVFLKKDNDGWKLFINNKPYFVKGFCYSPVPIGKSVEWVEDEALNNNESDEDGKFISKSEFYEKELQVVMDYSGNPLTHNFEPGSSYMELDSIGADEYMKITSWVDSSKNGWTMWGAAIKSPGNNNFGFREYVDLSGYSQIVFDVKADASTPIPDNCLKISIKDTIDADWGGAETKLSINSITSSWQTKKYNISEITTLTAITNAYLLFEFVIERRGPQQASISIT